MVFMRDDQKAKHLLAGHSCDNCDWMSDNDPICLYNGGQWLSEDNICEEWKKYEGMYDRR